MLPFIFSPPLPLRPLLLITAAELGILIALVLHGQHHAVHRRAVLDDADVVTGVLAGVLVPLDQLAQRLVRGVDELHGGEAALVAQARVGPGLEHHLDQGGAEVALGGRLAVQPADGGVQRGVAVEAGEGVALEVGLVEEEVDDLICAPFRAVLVRGWFGWGYGRVLPAADEEEGKRGLLGEDEQFPREAASW